jgi:OFA family oxalate/formate antiporter-like MFS transporter
MGSVYAWSIFVPLMKSQWGFSTAEIQLTIGFCIATFAFAMLFTGNLEKKIGPRNMASFQVFSCLLVTIWLLSRLENCLRYFAP